MGCKRCRRLDVYLGKQLLMILDLEKQVLELKGEAADFPPEERTR